MQDFIFSIVRRDGSFQLDSYEGSSRRVVIPSEHEGRKVTAIGDNAFSWHTEITSVIIPDSVIAIGEAVFSWCDHLEEIVLPESIKQIGEWAFIGCSALKEIVLPDIITV